MKRVWWEVYDMASYNLIADYDRKKDAVAYAKHDPDLIVLRVEDDGNSVLVRKVLTSAATER